MHIIGLELYGDTNLTIRATIADPIEAELMRRLLPLLGGQTSLEALLERLKELQPSAPSDSPSRRVTVEVTGSGLPATRFEARPGAMTTTTVEAQIDLGEWGRKPVHIPLTVVVS